ncbi:MAG: immunoglobulin domain-containing protein [Verrucomicrobia bacterium]|nr:immunoglobulin domain-containing protein [Verrucomicrobiota bacterium]
MKTFVALACGLTLSLLPGSRAQLAVTEVMSSAANTLNGQPATQNSDYWELTNFGDTPLDLTGYKFNDDGPLISARTEPFQGLIIGPGESVLFVRSDVNKDEQSVRDWWGPSLPAAAQIRFYPSPGFSSNGDMVQVWDPQDRLVDAVTYGAAVRGRSFTYDVTTGALTSLSTNGVHGAWLAATADDHGSPGVNAGPVPLAITQQPAAATVPAGNSVTLEVAAQGLPRPRYQWRKDGVDLPDATRATLTITNAQAADAGLYSVRVHNGLATLLSDEVRITVDLGATPPELTQLPVSLWAYEGQTATFTVAALGNPPPAYQWQRDGVNLSEGFPYEGVQTAQLKIHNVQPGERATYTVRVSNVAGSTNASATLTVTRKPRLVITEVLSSQATNADGSSLGHQDWWELTNLDDFAVNLRGYRFDDSSATLTAAFTVKDDLFIEPGESVIWVETMTADAFRQWWGADHLPANLKIITYSGPGLGLSSAGDAINVWNAAAADDADKVTSEVFSTATAGVSFGYNPDSGIFGDLSVAGVFGAFVAAELGDIGSPGWIRNPPPRPNFVSVKPTPAGIELTWQTVPGGRYSLAYKTALDAATWQTLSTQTAAGNTTSFVDASTDPHRFYRVQAE